MLIWVIKEAYGFRPFVCCWKKWLLVAIYDCFLLNASNGVSQFDSFAVAGAPSKETLSMTRFPSGRLPIKPSLLWLSSSSCFLLIMS